MLIGGRAHSLKEINYVGEVRLDFAEINLLNSHSAFQELPSLPLHPTGNDNGPQGKHHQTRN